MAVQKTASSRRRPVFRALWTCLGLLVILSLGLGLLDLLGLGVMRHYWPSRRAANDALGLEDPVTGVARDGRTEDPAQAMKRLLKWAEQGEADIEKNVHDYSAVVVKRERAGKDLSPAQAMFIKVRHHPFSVYLHFLAPDASKGQEAIYVEGQRNGNLVGHMGGWTGKWVGTWELDPGGKIAMRGQLHPIMEMGILHLTQLLAERARQQVAHTTCLVRTLPHAKINDRSCTCIEAELPAPTEENPKAVLLARIFIDRELHLPIGYEQYEWSGDPATEPLLVEQYIYSRLEAQQRLHRRGFRPAESGVWLSLKG